MADFFEPYEDYEVEEAVKAWGDDYFKGMSDWGDPIDNYWSEENTQHGGDWMVTLPVIYHFADHDASDWLDDLHVNMFRGDNNQDFSEMQDDCSKYLQSNGFEQLECVRARFQRDPAGEEEESEVVWFYIHIADLVEEE